MFFLIANLDLDRTSQLSYSEILSYEDRPISILPQSPFESRNVRHHGPCRPEMGMVRSLGRPCADGVLETETAFVSRGFEDSYATHSSSLWSPEASCCLFFILVPSTHSPLLPPLPDSSRKEVLLDLKQQQQQQNTHTYTHTKPCNKRITNTFFQNGSSRSMQWEK
jgi:hypothetical protein